MRRHQRNIEHTAPGGDGKGGCEVHQEPCDEPFVLDVLPECDGAPEAGHGGGALLGVGFVRGRCVPWRWGVGGNVQVEAVQLPDVARQMGLYVL
jgi:hypothetical protein